MGYWLPHPGGEQWRTIIDLAIVAWFSGFVAYAELVSRYHDSPARLVGAPPTPLYLLINIAAGIAALLIVNRLGIIADAKAPRLYAIYRRLRGDRVFSIVAVHGAHR